MGLLNLNLRDAANDFRSRIRNPFDALTENDPNAVRMALQRDDFKNGFQIVELINGREQRNEAIQLIGSTMPHVPFTFGGSQKIVKDYYPGNSEPSVQVLGSRESDISITGRMYAKKLPISLGDADIEQVREFPQDLQQLIEAMRIRGNLVRLYFGEFNRFGFIESTEFKMRTVTDIDYKINFVIIGFNPPRDCRVINASRQLPIDINKELITAVNNFTGAPVPDDLDRSLATQIAELTSDVATAVNLVTDFVDTVLDEVDAVRESIARAQGLIQNARNNITRLTNRIGSFSSTGGIVFSATAGVGVSSGYINASFMQQTLTNAFSLTAFLASLNEQIARIALTEPLARHRVQQGDTLQNLAVRFYKNVESWTEILEHNNLASTDLELIRGQIIEIPRIE